MTRTSNGSSIYITVSVFGNIWLIATTESELSLAYFIVKLWIKPPLNNRSTCSLCKSYFVDYLKHIVLDCTAPELVSIRRRFWLLVQKFNVFIYNKLCSLNPDALLLVLIGKELDIPLSWNISKTLTLAFLHLSYISLFRSDGRVFISMDEFINAYTLERQKRENRKSHWGTLAHFKDHETFGGIVQMLPQIKQIPQTRSTMIISKDLECGVIHINLVLYRLIQRGVSVSDVESFYYSISWYHKFISSINPCDDEFIKLIMEGGRRILAKPINKKEPVTIDILNKLIDKFGADKCNLLNLRICVLCLLGFSGFFFRFNELANIKLSDISFKQGYVEISIRKSKTDIYRRGNVIVISETVNKLCPVSWLRDYIKCADNFEILTATFNLNSL
ncbi:hypothetical protein KUTeg_021789 [Tegillarca granosa]|uniref:Tyr recombinase domain-containing protein n=1 Tax=Tegillarca granosa TaxID=220873 RepID=A0ABQ9E9X5_TEGGR|nr:hypothetical protein KUTeg_021789 [Tegillarca granosa]